MNDRVRSDLKQRIKTRLRRRQHCADTVLHRLRLDKLEVRQEVLMSAVACFMSSNTKAECAEKIDELYRAVHDLPPSIRRTWALEFLDFYLNVLEQSGDSSLAVQAR
ncbi:MAG: hypothetical protein F4Y86_18230 [Gammaproteobacteria bacterium]|nr:hypothetical protein [Gammaproteobacteria bacterium]